jgi:hypothetical protein
MNLVAIKMLVGDRAKYLGIIMGLTFASLLITQQRADGAKLRGVDGFVAAGHLGDGFEGSVHR